jgi:hypothetical protein
MFFKNGYIFLFARFFWLGLVMGLALILVDVAVKITRKNVYVFNLVTFLFVFAFGGVFAITCLKFYNYSFCWFGLLAMVLGTFLVKISIKFTFDKVVHLVYNGFTMMRGKKENGKLQRHTKS